MSNPVVNSVNTKYISIVPENGEVFNPGQKIIYNIEPNIGFMKRDSYMIFDILNNTADFTRYGLNALGGIHSIIENIRIYSKQTGVLLESCENYGQIQGIIHQYAFDDKENLVAKEGVGLPCIAKQNNLGGASNPMLLHSSEISNQTLSPVDVNGNPKYTSQRYMMSLRCGIFRYFDAERLIPILNFGGLRIEINLQVPELVLQKLDCSINGGAPDVIAGGFRHDNLVEGNGSLGKGVGPRAGGDTVIPLVVDNGAGESLSMENCGFAVGNSVRVNLSLQAGGTTGDLDRVITGMVVNAGTGTIDLTLSGANIAQTVQANSAIFARCPTPNYRITSTEFRICQVVPTQQQAQDLRQSINYEFTTWDLFLDNVPVAGNRHQTPINSVASKALAIISMPYDSTRERDLVNQQYYSGINPDQIFQNSLQFFINNRLYPLRAYNPNIYNDRVLTLNESQKALRAIGLTPLSLGRNEDSDLDNYNQTYLMCRELARNGFVFDLRNAEAEVRIGFSGNRTNIIRVNTFVFSKKIIETTENGVQVVL
tara:strand:- start:1884 stop:3503 length:1620 start_codon:yes stop_codon:yes gene_type:complete